MAVLQRLCCVIKIVCVLLQFSYAYRPWMTTDELENHINPEDLQEFLKMYEYNETHNGVISALSRPELDEEVDCFGLGLSFMRLITSWLLNMKPDTSEKVNTHYYFSSRKTKRVQVFPGLQFGLEWVDFDPKRKTVMIVHGFMSHSNASWIHDMTQAFLIWGDVNVIAVDWSNGGNTFRYWRAVANTRRVGSDVTDFLQQLKAATGANFKDFHFVGHSLGAHICSFVSHFIGGVERITGLDPAQPCFRTANHTERLDPTDAKFVDIIHTNGRLLKNIGFGWPEPTGHADFYPNGGMKQPGCAKKLNTLWSRLQDSVCSHGRAYLLFTESLVNKNCSFTAHQWDLTYRGVNSSLVDNCERSGSCAEMGINAEGGRGRRRASGTFFLLTTDKEPYCPLEETCPEPSLLRDLKEGFRLDGSEPTTINAAHLREFDDVTTESAPKTTKKKRWWQEWVG